MTTKVNQFEVEIALKKNVEFEGKTNWWRDKQAYFKSKRFLGLRKIKSNEINTVVKKNVRRRLF